MEAEVKWLKGMNFVAKSDSEHEVVIDVPEEGQKDKSLGPTPMELMLMGVGACTASDVMWILKKQRSNIERLEIRLKAERAAVEPKRFTKIHIEYLLAGKDLTEKSVARAIQLSQEKYCSATSSVVRGGAEITSSYRIVQ